MQYLLKIIEAYNEKIVMTLLGINTDIFGNEEYKFYLIIPNETMIERKENLNEVCKLLGSCKQSEEVDLFIDALQLYKDYKIMPLELCLSCTSKRIMIKSYFHMKILYFVKCMELFFLYL